MPAACVRVLPMPFVAILTPSPAHGCGSSHLGPARINCSAAMLSNLSKHLVWLFGKGDISAARLQMAAAAAASDGVYPNDELLNKISAAGNAGAISGHIHRDVIRACRRAGLMNSSAQPYILKLADDKGSINVFLPHEVYADFAAEVGVSNLILTPQEWALGHGLADLIRKWGAHPNVGISEALDQVAVLGLHCDGVPYTTSSRVGASKSIFAASMNVASAPDDRLRARRQPLFLLRKARLCDCGCQGFHSFQQLFDVLAWSLTILATRDPPTCRHDGSPWTPHDRRARLDFSGGLPRAALLQVRGDWDFFAQAFRVRSTSSHQFCWLCQATQIPGPFCYTCMDPDADHRSTLISNESYIQACMAEHSEPSTLFRSPGFSLQHLAIDSMHAGDLGAFQDFMGSLLWLEISNRQWPGNRAAKLQRLNTELSEYYAANASRKLSQIGHITQLMIFPASLGYPYLKAKAAQTRHLADFGLALAHRHMQGSPDRPPLRFRAGHHLHGRHDEHLHFVTEAAEGMVGYHRACAAEAFDPVACKNSMYRFLQSMSALNAMWRDGLEDRHHSVQPFHIRPKFHILQHLVEDQLLLWGSPSRAWCYRDEDFVGSVKKVASKSKNPATLEKVMTEKLMLLSGLGAHL